MSKGMHECAVCHREFALIAEDHYIAKDPTPTGLASLAGGTVYPYDAIDCPHCGCQNVLQKRKPFACPCDYGICDECDYECAEEEEIEDKSVVDEMKEYLVHFCNGRTCNDSCPLHTADFKCGRGKFFDINMSDEELEAAYKVVKGDK